MQSIFRILNIIISPVMTLVFAARFAGLTIAGKDAGDAVGGALAGLIMLTIELCLTQGPKYSARLRRFLDPRAAFEGLWIQRVHDGGNNRLGVFAMNYNRGRDSFTVSGKAYSPDGKAWAQWHSTHMFIDKEGLEATYRWEGDVLGDVPAAESDKSGLTRLNLRAAPALSLPMSGYGEVLHVGEARRIRFDLHRVTQQDLREQNLPFTLRELRTNANDEELKYVAAYLIKK